MAWHAICITDLDILSGEALARSGWRSQRSRSRFEVTSCREHSLHPCELNPRPPHSASSGHFQRIETAPIGVGKVGWLAFPDALFSRRGLGLSGGKNGALRQVFYHTPHRFQSVRFVSTDDPSWPAFNPTSRIFADAGLQGLGVQHSPLLIQNDPPTFVEWHARERDTTVPHRAKHQARG